MESGTPETRSNAWNEQAKYQLLLRIIAQTKENRPIKWDLINMPGRTTKSLQNMWTRINKEVQELEAQNEGEGSGVATPRKSSAKKSAGRGRPKKSDPIVPEEADDEEDVAPIPFKLASKKKRESLLEDEVSDIKRMKTEDDDVLLRAFKSEDGILDGFGDGDEC
ncbi:hypothetical protein ESCO_002999 [Escovopsis weberi]|uniref:Myb-like domain-containing protein n=1 Tax=Escovopsis weberi TaxID=150374 RepID=A0A0N0RT10_ESCWE|nr:hypothetical protein ESCO_002999 [Escovopsis weberi]